MYPYLGISSNYAPSQKLVTLYSAAGAALTLAPRLRTPKVWSSEPIPLLCLVARFEKGGLLLGALESS